VYEPVPVGLTQTVEVEVQLFPAGYGAPLPFGGGDPELTGGGGTFPDETGGGAALLLTGGGAAELDAGGAEAEELGVEEQVPAAGGLRPNCMDHWKVQRSLDSIMRPQ